MSSFRFWSKATCTPRHEEQDNNKNNTICTTVWCRIGQSSTDNSALEKLKDKDEKGEDVERHAGNDCLQLNCICVQLPVRISFKNHLDLYYLWIHFNLQIVVGYFIGPFLCCPIIRCLRHHNVNSKSRVNKKPCVCTCCSVKGGQTIVFADIAMQCIRCTWACSVIKFQADSAESAQTFCTAGIENITVAQTIGIPIMRHTYAFAPHVRLPYYALRCIIQICTALVWTALQCNLFALSFDMECSLLNIGIVFYGIAGYDW